MYSLSHLAKNLIMNEQYLEKLVALFKTKDQFAAYNHLEVVSVGEGKAKVQLEVEEQHLNAAGIAHGGVIFTLADFAMGLAAHSHGRMAVTLGADISFFSPGKMGRVIYATAEELSLRKSIATYLISVSDDQGCLLATMKCQAFRKGDLVI